MAVQLTICRVLAAVWVACVASASGAPLEAIPGTAQPIPRATGDSSSPELSSDGRWALFSSTAANLTSEEHLPFALDLFVRDLVNRTNYLVTRSLDGQSGGNGVTDGFSISADGKWALFESTSSNLVPDDTNEVSDIFRAELPNGPVTRVSVGPAPANAFLLGSRYGDMSGDGRFVVFETDLPLVAGDTDTGTDIYLRDLELGTTTLISARTYNAGARGTSSFPQISADGRYIVFESVGSDLVRNNDSNQGSDVFLYDSESKTNRLVSISRTSTAGDRPSYDALLSRDGRFVAFMSTATMLLSTNVPSNVVSLYVRDIANGTIVRIIDPNSPPGEMGDLVFTPDGKYLFFTSRSAIYRWDSATGSVEKVSPNAAAESPGVSADGNIIAFGSNISQVDPLQTNLIYQVLVKNISSNTLQIASLNAETGTPGVTDSYIPTLSADGSVVAFESNDNDLLPGDNNDVIDTFFVRLGTNSVVEWLSAPNEGQGATFGGFSRLLALTPSGEKVLFLSDVQIVAEDTNDVADAYVFDTQTRALALASARAQGGTSQDGTVGAAVISGNGRYVLFASPGSDIDGVDSNKMSDIFLRDLQAGTTVLLSTNRDGTAAGNSSSINPFISNDGRFVAYESSASDLVAVDNNNRPDVFVHDLVGGTRTNVSLGLNSSAFQATLMGMSGSGRYVVFRGAPSNPVRLNAYDTSSNALVTLIQGAVAVEPSFISEDDRWLVFSVGSGLSLYDFSTGETNLICSACRQPSISADGRYVAYRHSTNSLVMRYDRTDGTTVELSKDTGLEGGAYWRPRLSGNGALAVFGSQANVGADNAYAQIFLRDEAAQKTLLLSANADSEPGNQHSQIPLISDDGEIIVFQSYATDLIEDDRNNNADIYIYRAVTASPDSDNDGLPDEWEMTWFSNLNETAAGDPDADGLTNAEELQAGTNPGNNASVLVVDRFEAIIGQKVILAWKAVAGKKYQVEAASSFGPDAWQPAGEPITANSEVASFETNLTEPHKFYRVRLTE